MASIKEFLLDILFPKSCLNCKEEGSYFCPDCQALLEVSGKQFCPYCTRMSFDGKTCISCQGKAKLDGLYFAVPYNHRLMKRLISQFKYEPLIKELANPLASLIITHFQLLEKPPSFLEKERREEFYLIPIPCSKKVLKWRGFNPAEEIAKELSSCLEIPVLSDALSQNIKTIKGKKILLVDDIYTDNSPMQEYARILKEAEAKEVWGVAIARE